MRIGACQIKTLKNKQETLAKARKFVYDAAAAGAELIVLPEMFQCPYDNSFFREYSEQESDSVSCRCLSEWARENRVYLVGGSIPENDGGKIYNTSYIFDPGGNRIGKHRKVHLFDIDIPGGIRFMESDVLSPGNEVTVVDTSFGKIGVAICFDMRFPELMRAMALQGAKMIIVPAAFNMATGPAHWEITARMRALDNQVFFLAVSSARDMDFSYHAYGNTILTDPWGDVIQRLDEKEGIMIADVDFDSIERFRREFPIMKSRCEDVYWKSCHR